MNKMRFTGIIALMGISLLGIIAVQLYWMHEAITVKEQQFDQQVNQALSKAANRIERNQNAFFMSYLFSGMPQMQLQQQMMQGGSNRMNDSLILEFNDFWQDKSNQDLVVKKENNHKVNKTEQNGIETITYGFDTIIEDAYSSQRIQTYSSVSKPSQGSRMAFAKPERESNQNPMESQFSDVMQQMILEFSIKDIPIEERLSNSVVTPTLDYELKNAGISLKYEYGISNFRGKLYNKMKTNGFNQNKVSQAYKTTLFPNDILMQSDQLLLYFPEKSNYLIQSIIYPFSGSLLFTLIILFTFYYTLRIIYNQKKTSEVKTDFINNMTHEFKTPIATISLAADSINNPNIITDADKVRRFTEIIKEENRRMNRQVESVLKMALIDKKDFNLNMVETDVHPLIRQAVKNISLQVEQKGGTLEMELKAENDRIKADETHLVNVIFNLLDNANKYSLDAPPEITLTTYNQQDNLVIAISDKGIGMDKDTQEKIFEKFYRVPTGDVHNVKGFGLGLSYVKAITMQFKGDVHVISQKGKGSTFEIRIPLKIG
ncbi:MAG: HAMP domain-containing sensor histidine kinase [Salinivirgaceae bacterium]